MPGRSRKSTAVAESRPGLVTAVSESLSELTLAPEDAALAELALEYARTIERAAIIAAQAAKIPFDPDTAEEVARLRAKVSAHSTMADLGPKLMSALDALGATPKARSSNGKAAPSKSGKLASLRSLA